MQEDTQAQDIAALKAQQGYVEGSQYHKDDCQRYMQGHEPTPSCAGCSSWAMRPTFDQNGELGDCRKFPDFGTVPRNSRCNGFTPNIGQVVSPSRQVPTKDKSPTFDEEGGVSFVGDETGDI